jgi:hypothetical protein
MKKNSIRGYLLTSQSRLNCILWATRNESSKEAAKASRCATIIKGLRNLNRAAGGFEVSVGP